MKTYNALAATCKCGHALEACRGARPGHYAWFCSNPNCVFYMKEAKGETTSRAVARDGEESENA